jgi:hypothetical protein
LSRLEQPGIIIHLEELVVALVLTEKKEEEIAVEGS